MTNKSYSKVYIEVTAAVHLANSFFKYVEDFKILVVFIVHWFSETDWVEFCAKMIQSFNVKTVIHVGKTKLLLLRNMRSGHGRLHI